MFVDLLAIAGEQHLPSDLQERLTDRDRPDAPIGLPKGYETCANEALPHAVVDLTIYEVKHHRRELLFAHIISHDHEDHFSGPSRGSVGGTRRECLNDLLEFLYRKGSDDGGAVPQRRGG